MPDEETKPEEGTSAPASGEEKPEEAPETKPDAPETPDYKAEAEKKEKELKDREEQLRKAGFTIEKLKTKMKEEGIELEEGQGLTEEQVADIVSKVVGDKLGEISKENQELKTTLSEVLKTIGSKANASKGGGEGGQKPPKEEGTPRPALTEDEEQAVVGMTWDSKRGGWQEPDIKDPAGNVLRKGQFFPHKRKTTSPKEE